MGAKFRNALGRDIHARESALQFDFLICKRPSRQCGLVLGRNSCCHKITQRQCSVVLSRSGAQRAHGALVRTFHTASEVRCLSEKSAFFLAQSWCILPEES